MKRLTIITILTLLNLCLLAAGVLAQCQDPFAIPPANAIGWYILNSALGHRDPASGFFKLPDVPIPQSKNTLNPPFWAQGLDCKVNNVEVWHLHGTFDGHADPDPAVCGHGCLQYQLAGPTSDMDKLDKLTYKVSVSLSKYVSVEPGYVVEKAKIDNAYFQLDGFSSQDGAFNKTTLCAPDNSGNYIPITVPMYTIGTQPANFIGWFYYDFGGNPAFVQGMSLSYAGNFKVTLDKDKIIKNATMSTIFGGLDKRFGGDKGDPNTNYSVQMLKASGKMVNGNDIPSSIKLQCQFTF